MQRRYQKVIEVAPSFGLPDEVRASLYDYAVRIAEEVQYNNVGTVEFLVDQDHKISDTSRAYRNRNGYWN